MTTESVYERRELTWLGRLRRRFGREVERQEHQEPLLDGEGNPTMVVAKGRLIGVRDTKGDVIKFPEPPRNPRDWPAEWWGDEPEWIRLDHVLRRSL